jgi:hypothetical protein
MGAGVGGVIQNRFLPEGKGVVVSVILFRPQAHVARCKGQTLTTIEQTAIGVARMEPASD